MRKQFAIAALVAVCAAAPAVAQDQFLEETVGFAAEVLFISNDVPGMVIGVTANGNRAVYGFGSISKDVDRTPDGDTTMRIGSVTKSFTGLALAHLAADNVVDFTDTLAEHLPDLPIPESKNPIRLVHLATHSAGFKRELTQIRELEKYSLTNYFANLEAGELLFAPGEGVLYSNLGFDLLGMALASASGKETFSEVLEQEVLMPIGLTSTAYEPSEAAKDNMMTGHLWTGEVMPDRPTPERNQGSSSLVTTTNDMLTYLEWNLDRLGEQGAEARALSHAAHLIRDGLEPVSGMDESGHMDAMGLGWVIMMPDGDRPLILQKAGGANGVLCYLAFAPHRNVGVFVAINEFDFPMAMEMAEIVNELIGALAPR